MSTIGSNLLVKGRYKAMATLARLLGLGFGQLRRPPAQRLFVCEKVSDMAPTTNTAADSPGRASVFCIHYNAAGVFQHVYMCTAYTNDTTFTWTQVVLRNFMPLTRLDIRTAVIQNTQRSDKVDTINLAINLAVNEITQRHKFRVKRVEETLSINEGDISFPIPQDIDNLIDVRCVDSIGTLVHRLRIKSKVELERVFPALGNYPVSGTPAYGYEENGVLHFMPVASRSFSMIVTGDSPSVDLDDDTDQVIPGVDLAVIAYATAHLFRSIQLFPDAQAWDQQFEKALLLAKRNDKKKSGTEQIMEQFPPKRPRYIVDPTLDPWK